ncbi:endolysin [Burkholderia phage BCSR5]|nr:endolysin [Burkholderia phage BCSR5]
MKDLRLPSAYVNAGLGQSTMKNQIRASSSLGILQTIERHGYKAKKQAVRAKNEVRSEFAPLDGVGWDGKRFAQPRRSGEEPLVPYNEGDPILFNRQVDTTNKAEQVMDAEKDSSLVQRVEYASYLPFAAKTYHISPRIEDYIIVSTPICPSDIPNRNGIGFPIGELVKWLAPPHTGQSYKLWSGCPVHLEHDNEDCTKAHGIILDTSLHRINGYGAGKLWKVMGLLAIDKNKYPDIAAKVLSGELNTYSMGALVDYFTCSYCGAEITDKNMCGHVGSPKQVNFEVVQDWDGSNHLAYLRAHNIQPIECSIVADPAWTTALSDNLLGTVTS